MNKTNVIAAIFDVETKDIMLIQHTDGIVNCIHFPPATIGKNAALVQPDIHHIKLDLIYAGTRASLAPIGFAGKCSCGKVYVREV